MRERTNERKKENGVKERKRKVLRRKERKRISK